MAAEPYDGWCGIHGYRKVEGCAGCPGEVPAAAICHCGRAVEPRNPDPWDGRMDAYCEDCAINRCDCYPDECPIKHPQASSAASTLPALAVRATMPSEEFPMSETRAVCARRLPRELRDAELALGFYYREQAGEIKFCPPRSGIEIRRDIRRLRIRLRGLRKRLV